MPASRSERCQGPQMKVVSIWLFLSAVCSRLGARLEACTASRLTPAAFSASTIETSEQVAVGPPMPLLLPMSRQLLMPLAGFTTMAIWLEESSGTSTNFSGMSWPSMKSVARPVQATSRLPFFIPAINGAPLWKV